jgi:EAL domain-containing protein (putative c-di-GMP-specific phosphodiesterase class I)/CheY-like chemotaxis protein
MTRVLLVERDPSTRDRLALALRKARFEVRSAGDAHDGLKLVADEHPEVVVFGVCGQDMSLSDLCLAARAAAASGTLAIIALLLSDATASTDVRAAILAGADDALPIPEDPLTLIEAVRARERRLPNAAPASNTGAVAHAAIESALATMVRPVLMVMLELEDASAIASIEGSETLRALDDIWCARIRALIPEQAFLFPQKHGTCIILLPGSTPEPRSLLAALGGTGQPAERIGALEMRMRAAMGVVRIEPGEVQPPVDLIIARSKYALQIASRGRQPRIHFHAEEDAISVLREVQLATMLQRALEQGDFRLVYQPKVSIATGATVGAEALIRWTLPTTGEAIAPIRLLAIAEDAGLLDEIGGWALREACRECAAWSLTGVDIPVSVNIAASQFRRGDLVDEVRLALSETALPGRLLTLEIQEGVLVQDGLVIQPQLEMLRVTGVRISIDDFGTGIAGVAMLRKFPIDELKIDQSVIARLPGSADDRAMVDTALRHARQLNIDCVAEGVESAAQWAFLAEHGWDAAQGWHIAHPIAGSSIPGFVRREPDALAASTRTDA